MEKTYTHKQFEKALHEHKLNIERAAKASAARHAIFDVMNCLTLAPEEGKVLQSARHLLHNIINALEDDIYNPPVLQAEREGK